MHRTLTALSLALLILLGPTLAGCLGSDGGDAGNNDDIQVGDQTVPDRVTMVTSKGTIVIELAKEAPRTVANFKKYVEAGFYDGLIFHRVIDGFMIQGGGFYDDMTQKAPLYQPVDLEITSLRHDDGVISMARTNDPDSATSQFFITDGPQHFLDGPEGSTTQGYSVFGHVVSGMEVVRAISAVPVQYSQLNPSEDSPSEPITPVYIVSATLG